ncbi:MAG: ROK family protein, partial [Chloroflexia bacterium]
PLCACGSHGCLESMAAGPAIARMAREAITCGAQTSLCADHLTAKTVYNAAANGDALAYSITRKVGRYLAQSIQQLIMHYDIERIILGGGVSKAGPYFLNPILEALEAYRAQSDFLREMIRPGMITLLDPTYDAGPWGGIELATDLIEAKQNSNSVVRHLKLGT